MMIKVNLPKNEESYVSGNGEGCWVEIEDEAINAYENHKCGLFEATFLNWSIYYPQLNYRSIIPIELRGKDRPVVPIDWLYAQEGQQ